MIRRVVSGARARWAGWQRYSRLRAAVMGCLGVMFILAVALILSVRGISSQVEQDLVGAEQLAAAAASARDAGGLLESWRGTSESRGGVIAALDELDDHVARLNTHGSIPQSVALGELTQATEDLVDGSTEGSFAVTTNARVLASQFSQVSAELAEASVEETKSATRFLNAWSVGIQAIAISAALMFMAIVVTQILPLMRSIQRSMGKLNEWSERSVSETRRRKLTRDVAEGLEAAADEPAAYAVIERALTIAAPTQRAEMMLADSSNAHLRASVVHSENGAPGCGVVSPWSCPAVRRGTTQSFDDSQAIRACPHLSKHESPCSAVCAPMTFMGEPMGVLHVTGPVGETPDEDLVRDLSMLASESATRIGTLRAFDRAELQAATDVLTGLPNRRATEDQLRKLLIHPDGGSAAVVEVIGVPALNDRLGRLAGDHALKVAAEALRDGLRDGDWCGRWNGSEFVVTLPATSASSAREVVEQMGAEITARLESADFAGLRTAVGIADTRRARTAHGMMGLIGEALRDARGEPRSDDSDDFVEGGQEADKKIFANPQLSTP